MKNALQPPAEKRFERELSALKSNDQGPSPGGWQMGPRSVRTFILGSEDQTLSHKWRGDPTETVISRKFYGDDALVERAIVTLLGRRGLLLVGEPGTAKSMLSELLAAAISGNSLLTVQGGAGLTEDQILYSWNYARLLAQGPGEEALVPGPVLTAMSQGQLVRFEELTRCAPEVQDTLISVLSDKVLHIAELGEEQGARFAVGGFNIIGTANIRDRGVHEMSSALKRRFNFETVYPIADRDQEVALVKQQTEAQLAEVNCQTRLNDEVLDLLVTTFRDLRSGKTAEGIVVDKPGTVVSTAEAVAVGVSAGLDAAWLGEGRVEGAHVARQLTGTVFKDDEDDIRKLKRYFDIVVKQRARKSGLWKSYYGGRPW